MSDMKCFARSSTCKAEKENAIILSVASLQMQQILCATKCLRTHIEPKLHNNATKAIILLAIWSVYNVSYVCMANFRLFNCIGLQVYKTHCKAA